MKEKAEEQLKETKEELKELKEKGEEEKSKGKRKTADGSVEIRHAETVGKVKGLLGERLNRSLRRKLVGSSKPRKIDGVRL